MADQNSYLRYKRDTRHLLYWMIHTSNNIIKVSAGDTSKGLATNTTGQITVSSLEPMARLIAKHIKSVPSIIFRIFESVIAERTATHSLFLQIVAKNRDPEIEKSNASHKAFIDGLTAAFTALGGEEWRKNLKSQSESPEDEDNEEDIFVNTFASLNLDEPNEEEDPGEELEEEVTETQRPRKKAAGKGKGKKGKRAKKSKGKATSTVKEPDLDDVPLESYRIIEDQKGLITDYLMAVYSLVKLWCELRTYSQGLWRRVSYGGLNSAVGGAMSNMAVAMVKQTELAIFVDFPAHDAYETVMNTITRGNPEKAQGMFSVSLSRIDDNDVVEKVEETHVDVKEEFMIYAYWDLLAFITDFQSTRSGKPTKPMLAEIRNWDPKFNLQRASKEQRIKWRRAYTINWLYDLVNVFSSIVVQRNTMKGQHWVYENVDWSKNGPWYSHRRLFGLNEFAGDITTLAMQKPGTDIKLRIMPHHVFQLQLIVDSLAVSRGWSINALRGHILHAPAQEFRPRRDVDLFIDRDAERYGRGYHTGVHQFIQFLEQDAMLHGNPRRHEDKTEFLKEFADDFNRWAGETMYAHRLNTIAPSQFTSTNANGLWEYSPYLCGVGLTEALELSYGMGFLMADRMPEPMCLIHLHNMLGQKGYLKPLGLFQTLEQLYPTTFFKDGKAPESDFGQAFSEFLLETGSRRAEFERRTIRKGMISRGPPNIHRILSTNANRFYKQKSVLQMYEAADWIPDKIPDEDVPLASLLAALRLAKTKQVYDPVTKKKVLEATPIVTRARAKGMNDEAITSLAEIVWKSEKDEQPIPQAFIDSMPKDYTVSTGKESAGPGRSADKGIYGGRRLLNLLEMDILGDICGETLPFSSLNYIWVMWRCMLIFTMIENELKKRRHPLWVKAYEENQIEKRAVLTKLILATEDEECMEVMAEKFQQPTRAGFMNHIYWDDLDDMDTIKKKLDSDPLDADEPAFMGGQCSVM